METRNTTPTPPEAPARTLALSPVLLKPAALALAFVLLGATLLEGFARTPLADALLPPPGVGSTHHSLDVKLYRLEQLTRQQGGIDCIIVGSSVADRGIDPETLADHYAEASGGEPLTCYNFGLARTSAAEAALLAEVLTERYDPQVLIYATIARDYDISFGNREELIERPWMQYHLGEPSLSGWLAEHSRAYRYFLAGVFWLTQPQGWPDRVERAQIVTRYGYAPSDRVVDPANLEGYTVPNYRIHEEDRAALRDMLALQTEGVRVVVVSLPLPQPSVEAFGPGVYDAFRRELAAEVEAGGGLYLDAFANVTVPLGGWHDQGHVNDTGAQLISAWVGEQLGEAAPLDAGAATP